MYNLHYIPQLWGYKVEEKLYLGVREQKKVEYHWYRRYSSYSLSTAALDGVSGQLPL
jgi:hypothetical protein